MGIGSIYGKYKLKKQLRKEEAYIPPTRYERAKEATGDIINARYSKQISLYGKKRSLRSVQRGVYSFIDDLSRERNKTFKGKKGKRKNPFGKIKDRSITEGGFF